MAGKEDFPYSATESGDFFKDLNDRQGEWGKNMMLLHRVDKDRGSGVLGFGRHADYMEAVTVFVAPRTDTSDNELFPTTVEGEPVVYLPVTIPYSE